MVLETAIMFLTPRTTEYYLICLRDSPKPLRPLYDFGQKDLT